MPSNAPSSRIVKTARLWIRYSPIPLFKEWLWDRSRRRVHQYKAKTRHGTVMTGRSNDLVQGYIYYFGEWEPNVTAWLLKRFARMKGRVFLDVGANVGYYSLLAGLRIPGKGSVVAVEASPVIHRMLADNVRLNRLRNVRTVCCAALADDRPVTLYHGGPENLGGTTVVKVGERRGVVVSGRPLADIVRGDELRRVRLIKIDVEGAEWLVVQGLLPVFERLPRDVELVVDIVPDRMPDEDLGRLFDLMEAEGFFAYRIESSLEPRSYLYPDGVKPPRRLHGRPTESGEVVFSRVDAETL